LTQEEHERLDFLRAEWEKDSQSFAALPMCVISHRDRAFQKICIQFHNFDLFTGPVGVEEASAPGQTKKKFNKKSLEYRVFVEMCKEKGWETLPRKGQDADLDEFMRLHEFNRNQVQRKFKELQALESTSIEENNAIYLSFLKRAPSTEKIIERVKMCAAYNSASHHGAYSEESFFTNLFADIGIWTNLRNKILEALASCLQGKIAIRQKTQRAKSYYRKEIEIRQYFSEHHSSGSKPKEALIYLLTGDFFNELHLYLFHGREQRDNMQVTINSILEQAPELIVSKNKDIQERLCYVMGFALQSAVKQDNNVLIQVAMNNSSSVGDASLPIGLIDRTKAFGALVYPKRDIYIFGAYLEKICETILTPENQVVHGNRISQDLLSHLVENKILQDLFKENIAPQVDDDELQQSAFSFFVKIYIRMRSKDYVKRYLGEAGLSLTKGLRPTMAMISDPRLRHLSKQDVDHLLGPAVGSIFRPKTLFFTKQETLETESTEVGQQEEETDSTEVGQRVEETESTEEAGQQQESATIVDCHMYHAFQNAFCRDQDINNSLESDSSECSYTSPSSNEDDNDDVTL
jgi:hypothetical protein